MRQYVLPTWYDGHTEITLSERDFHYLVRVLRLQEGDSFPGIDKEGNRYQVVIKTVNNTTCTLSVQPWKERDKHRTRSPRITLFQALPKGKTMDTIIRQAAEMGVAAVYPFESDYTIAKIEASQVRKKQQRWSKIVEEAVQQSGSSVFTTVHDPVQLRSIDTIWKGGEPALFFHQNQLSQTTLHHYLEHGPEEVGLVIGPEGGFSDDELVYLQTHAFQPVYLGENVLRTETAAVYAVAAVQTILLEKNSWQLHP